MPSDYALPNLCALITGDGTLVTFQLILATERHRAELRACDGFILVTLAWTLLAVIATVPLLLHQSLSFTDALLWKRMRVPRKSPWSMIGHWGGTSTGPPLGLQVREDLR